MKQLKKRRPISPGNGRRPTHLVKVHFINSSIKKERICRTGLKVSEEHLPKDNYPTLQLLERDYIKKVLSHVRENKSRAAEILGIDRVSLWRKIKKYAIAMSAE